MKTRIEVAGDVGQIILDDPGHKVNTLGREMLRELGEALDLLLSDPLARAIVIRSGKPGTFVAGADVHELSDIALAPGAREAALAASVEGQALMNRIEDGSKPVVAAIDGACLGGGLELALAAHARVVTSSPVTQLGFPELKLGIVPGFGGTWRGPRLLGLVRGLEAILTSRNYDGRSAFKAGLADELCFPEQLETVSGALALEMLNPRFLTEVRARRKRALPLGLRILQFPLIRAYVFHKSRSRVLAKMHGRLPAPLRAIDVVASGWGRRRSNALSVEAAALADTLATPEAANLVRLFLLSQAARKPAGPAAGIAIRSAGVVGSGLMGSGIAVALVDKAGIPTTMKDTSLEMLGKALKKTWEYEGKKVRRHQLDRREADRRFHLLSACTDYSGLKSADLVIEAVPEILQLKQAVYEELEAVVSERAVIASNTSSLPISELAGRARHPERLVGMHFFSPADVMPLVEVIAGQATSPAAVATAVTTASRMGKVPVVVSDSPGFLVNRILAAYALEAAQMVDEGVPAEKVDRAALHLGMPVGPVRLVAEVGVDVMRKVLRQLQSHFGDHLPAPAWIDRDDLASAFERRADGKWSVRAAVLSSWIGKPDPDYPARDIEDRLFLSLVNESARCLQEGIVASPGLLDLAVVYGTGFPAERGGPLRDADTRGLSVVMARTLELAGRYLPPVGPAPLLVELAEHSRTFFSLEGSAGRA